MGFELIKLSHQIRVAAPVISQSVSQSINQSINQAATRSPECTEEEPLHLITALRLLHYPRLILTYEPESMQKCRSPHTHRYAQEMIQEGKKCEDVSIYPLSWCHPQPYTLCSSRLAGPRNQRDESSPGDNPN